MQILLIDNGTKHLRSLKKLLSNGTVTTVPLFAKYPSSNDFDLIVLSGGSKFSVLKYQNKFAEEIKLVKNSKTPIIGICEGCEIIAFSFGSILEKLIMKTRGIKEISLIGENTFITSLNNFKVYEAHRFAITKLGKNLIGLAKSKDGFEIIKHKNKNIFGFQFHPEMLVERTLGDDIFRSLIQTLSR
jgi:GMP synthase (glutamine-hydrolysing)